MSQTSYVEQSGALNGQKYDLAKGEDVISLAAEGRIEFGRFVSLGTDKDTQCIHPVLATDITNQKAKRGVALQTHAIENKVDGLEPGYEDKRPVSILTKRRVYVEVEQDVTPADDVYVRFDDTAGGAGGTNTKGIFRKDADTATAALLADARWYKSSVTFDGKKIAVLELL